MVFLPRCPLADHVIEDASALGRTFELMRPFQRWEERDHRLCIWLVQGVVRELAYCIVVELPRVYKAIPEQLGKLIFAIGALLIGNVAQALATTGRGSSQRRRRDTRSARNSSIKAKPF
jgi:hypothetical protein